VPNARSKSDAPGNQLYIDNELTRYRPRPPIAGSKRGQLF